MEFHWKSASRNIKPNPDPAAWVELGPFWGMIRQPLLHRSCNLPGAGFSRCEKIGFKS